MGTLIRFPEMRRAPRGYAPPSATAETGSVVILPVIRIERHSEDEHAMAEPERGAPAGGRRRRRRHS